VSDGASAGVSDGATVGEAEELAAVGVGVAEGLAAVGVGGAVLSTANSARGNWALPCPSRARTVGGLEGTLVAVGTAVDVRGGSTVGVSGGTLVGASGGAKVGEAERLAAVGAGVAVLSTANSARGNWALPCPSRG
jgi:hypothetical protein